MMRGLKRKNNGYDSDSDSDPDYIDNDNNNDSDSNSDSDSDSDQHLSDFESTDEECTYDLIIYDDNDNRNANITITPPTPHRKKRRKKVIPIPITDPVNTLNDLIALGELYNPKYEYDCILDLETLHNLLEPLKQLNNMIGMKKFKNNIVNQLIFQLTGLRDADRNGKDPTMMHTVLLGSPGVGKCFSKGTPVRMYDGTVREIQDIKVCDTVMGLNSAPREVLGLGHGYEQLYEIDQGENGDRYIVNESHILSLKRLILPYVTKKSDHYRVTWYNYYGIYSRKFFFKPETQKTVEREATKLLTQITLSSQNNTIDISVKEYFQRSVRWRQGMGGFGQAVRYSEPIVDPPDVDSLLNEQITWRNTSLKFRRRLAQQFTSATFSSLFLAQKVKNVIDSTGIYYARLTNPDDTEICVQCYPRAPVYPITVKKLTEGEYFGFELVGDEHHFLLGDGTVVHNTTVAQIIGDIYARMGYLSRGHFTTAKRSDLVGKYLGHTAVKTQRLLESARGGVLFIDEAYSLGPNREDGDSFSKECIDTLNQFLTENADDFICIIAGYKNELNKCFFSRNPGLERRFPYRYTIENYNADELCEIFAKFVTKSDWTLATDQTITASFFQSHLKSFPGFGGDVKVFFDNCKIAHARRTFILPPKHWKKLTAADIQAGFALYNENKELDNRQDNRPPLGMYR